MSEPFPETQAEPPRRLAEVARFLRADAARYADHGGWVRNPGFWIGATHRLSEWARLESRPLPRHALLLPLAGFTKLWRASTGVSILDGATFGPGLCMPRARSLMIGRVRTGQNVLISDHVTIGTNANSAEFAVIGNEIEIGPGARILGPVRISDRARIGPNAVVTRNVPPGAQFVTAPPGSTSGRAAARQAQHAIETPGAKPEHPGDPTRNNGGGACAHVETHQP